MKTSYFFTGMPLSGKSTIARRLAEEQGLDYVSSGNYARSLGMGLEPSIKERDLSDAHNEEIMAHVLSRAARGDVVVDGFPRSVEQYLAMKMALAGIECKVYFITENPLIIFDRLDARRQRDDRPEDVHDVVLGRIHRSNEWRRELSAVCPEVTIINGAKVLEGKTVLEALCYAE